MMKHPRTFCVGGFATKIDEDGAFVKEMDYPPQEQVDIIKMVVKDCRNPIIDPSVMFRKDVFNEIGGYSLDESIYTVPDFELWLNAMSKSCLFHNLQEALVKYRVHEDGLTVSKQEEMVEHHKKVWRDFIERQDQEGKE